MDYRYDAVRDEYKLLDVNPRIGATFRAFVDDLGWDVARVMYADLAGVPVVAGRSRDGRRWLVENSDVASAVRYGRAGRLGVRGWLRSLRGVEELAWFARDDPAPFVSMLRRAAVRLEPARWFARMGRSGPRVRPEVAAAPDRR